MTFQSRTEHILRDASVPASMIRDAASFGGASDGDCLIGDLRLRDGVAIALTPTGRPARRMVTPRLTECHVHLDKCHTIHRMQGIGGDLREAIAAQMTDKQNWSADDIRTRARRGLDELIAAGCGAVRSHVDWTQGDNLLTPPLAWDVLDDLAETYRGEIDLQLSPLIGADDLAHADVEALAKLIADQRGVLGVFVLDHEDRRARVETAFALAERFGLPLDFHVDEGLEDGLNGLQIIAEVALRRNHQGPVLCGHACSLMNREGDDLKRLVETVAASGVTVCALPSTNLYLQSRSEGAPDRRGVTRLRELQAAGVNVAVGTDNVRDAFCPLGRHNPLRSLELAAMAAHLDPPYGRHLPMIAANAQRAMGLDPVFVDGAALDDLAVHDARDTTELITSAAAPRRLTAILEEELT